MKVKASNHEDKTQGSVSEIHPTVLIYNTDNRKRRFSLGLNKIKLNTILRNI